jgi:hypothetical protein
MDLAVERGVASGTWRERTDPDGYYQGVIFTGAVQFIIAKDSLSMTGRWVGHSRDMSEVNTGTWTLTLARSLSPSSPVKAWSPSADAGTGGRLGFSPAGRSSRARARRAPQCGRHSRTTGARHPGSRGSLERRVMTSMK